MTTLKDLTHSYKKKDNLTSNRGRVRTPKETPKIKNDSEVAWPIDENSPLMRLFNSYSWRNKFNGF